VSQHRPKSAANGVRFGEADHPGPPGKPPLSGRKRKGDNPKKKDWCLEGEHNFFICTLGFCCEYHFHPVKREGLSGAARRVKEKERSRKRDEGESVSKRPVVYEQCSGLCVSEDITHFHHMEQTKTIARSAMQLKSTQVTLRPASAAQEPSSDECKHDTNFDADDFSAFLDPADEIIEESDDSGREEETPEPEMVSEGEEDEEEAERRPLLKEESVGRPGQDDSEKGKRVEAPDNCAIEPKRDAEDFPVDLTIEVKLIKVLRVPGQQGLSARAKSKLIKWVSHTEDNVGNSTARTHEQQTLLGRRVGRTKFTLREGKVDKIGVLDGYYQGHTYVYIYPALIPYLDYHGFDREGETQGRVNKNTEAFLRQRLKVMKGFKDYITTRHTDPGCVTETMSGHDIIDDTLVYWLQGHLARAVKKNMRIVSAGVPKNFSAGGCPTAPRS
jgi:hypothetical protein